MRTVTAVSVTTMYLGVLGLPGFGEVARAGERQFLVILATSPKQYPNENRNPLGHPTGGLQSRQAIFNQYFDTSDDGLGSFAEYWEEISYGDVTISGNVTDWINLQWPIEPPLLDPELDDDIFDEGLDDTSTRNTPANFYDLNRSGEYEYGHGEFFDNTFAEAVIDLDGDPGGGDNGPYVVEPGSRHRVEAPFFYPVWKPGERFVDMDEDGRWDGLDEANNSMDWLNADGENIPDGIPDLAGPWVDLNDDDAADNDSNCLYLADSDNDGNPDCCPNGPGTPGCSAYDPEAAGGALYKQPCPSTEWTGPEGAISDCNGNLIPDACDLSCVSQACRRTGWLDSPAFIDTGLGCSSDSACRTDLGFSCDPDTDTCRLCGASQDELPYNASGSFCAPTRDQVPDECQFVGLSEPCVENVIEPDDACYDLTGGLVCVPQDVPRSENLSPRCEYDDSNDNDDLDIVEPFENFLRRWDPCIIAPEASPDNRESFNAHWVKVYDPLSPFCANPSDPGGEQFFQQLQSGCVDSVSTFNYCDDAYIRDNYPARARLCSESRVSCNEDEDCPEGESCRTGVEELIEEASGRLLWGSHDPDGKLEALGQTCVCPSIPCEAAAECTGFSSVALCAGLIPCSSPFDCGSEDPDACFIPEGNPTAQRYCRGTTFCTCVTTENVVNGCPAGFHMDYNPPDHWFDQTTEDGPNDTEVRSAKLRPAGDQVGATALLLGDHTPRPGTYLSPYQNPPTEAMDEPWYDQAWEDRYAAVSCENHGSGPAYVPCECELGSFDPTQPEGPANVRRGACEPPSWPGQFDCALPCTTDADCAYGGGGATCDVPAGHCVNDCGGLGSRARCDTARRVCTLVQSSVPNVRPFIPFDDVDTDGYESLIHRRYFKANAGGLHGDGTGWIGCDNDLDGFVVFETGSNESGFEELCNFPILPEETEGTDEPGIFYDGWVEHDDLASSKYHRAGDQYLGEVTSPFRSTVDLSGKTPEDDDEVVLPANYGEDRGIHIFPSAFEEDDLLVAAGPYATDIHGNHHRDAGNVLTMEVLTWRREPPFNTGTSWERDLSFDGRIRRHPYAGSLYGPNLGFRDYNLDGLLDLGETRFSGSANYVSDSHRGTANDGIQSAYPFNRNRMMEDCVEALDQVLDFDDWVDPVAMDRVTCSAQGQGGPLWAWKPPQFVDANVPSAPNNSVQARGILSGIVLLPRAAHRQGLFNLSPQFLPIHNEDADDPADIFPAGSGQLSWNLFFHNLVHALDVSGESGSVVPTGFQSRFSAHEYLHAWEGFPDLYDYDVYEPPPRPVINCPIGAWDIMASGGFVHPSPILKEKPCTEWTSPIDLTTVLTPGVKKTLTLPRSEFVRDSYYFLENENNLGERYYFWSAGRGFDTPRLDAGLPGAGMLIQHTDVGSNPEAWPPSNITGTRYSFHIIQADGDGELDLCENRGDAGDPWPGTTGATEFNFDSNPAARWYAQNSWTGIDISDIRPDGEGSVAIDITWVSPSIPSLRFEHPPGGVSQNNDGRERYKVTFTATDVFGGTTVRLYYLRDEKKCSVSGTSCTDDSGCPTNEFCRHDTSIDGNFIGERRTTTPGTNNLSIDWDITAISDGRYVVFAELIPGLGADGVERSFTNPRPGRNNVGDGTLTFGTCSLGAAPCNNSSDCGGVTCVIPAEAVNISGHRARSEAWTATCIDANTQTWSVFSTLTQPIPDSFDPEDPPYPLARTGLPYSSAGGEVRFTINPGPRPFVQGDTFSFVTTGKTAVSGSVTILDGKVKQDPTARITATPLAGDPPLLVRFDGRSSTDPNGEQLSYLWNFGDGDTATGSQTQHTFDRPGLATVVLRVTNTRTGRFGEASVDIDVTNNRPQALVTASPRSGPPSSECVTLGYCSLTVEFSAAQSTDTEDRADQMTYVWNFGDGASANDALNPGTAFVNTSHFYSAREDGSLCTTSNPCEFTATLTVYDSGGKSDGDTVTIMVGNSLPVANITHSSLTGSDPFTVVYNSINCFDPDPEDTLSIEWVWGDGTPNETYGIGGVAGDGLVPHEYVLPAGESTATYQTFAVLRDLDSGGNPRGGEVVWGPTTVTIREASEGSSDPTPCFNICSEAPCFETDPTVPRLGEEFTVDAGCSHDNPPGGQIASFAWDFADGTTATGMTATHTYNQPGTYAISLTVTDSESPANSRSTFRAVSIPDDGPVVVENAPPIPAFVVNPPNGYAEVTLFTFDASGSTDPDGPSSGLTYRWNFGDGTTAVGKVATHTYDEPNPDGSASYIVRLTVRDEGNASADAIQLVGVADNEGNLPPVAHIATGPRSGTAPVSLTFDGRNSFDPNNDPLEFTWEFKKNGLPVDTLIGPIVTRLFDEPGTFTVELTVDDLRGGVAMAGPETITISPQAPQPGENDGDGDGVADADDDCPNTPAGETVDATGCPIDDEAPAPRPNPCGMGMIPGVFGSLLGLVTLLSGRRRRLR
jgi:PKD repeat protein